ncbi:unnamed protein product [Acanthoscelides obtectus]|uniref:DDE Tnp4 domain-containing protein n=1 Tax=Acanthoscelides obtectus TaxID=200917 RepID=A0A9P0KG87_ACAOB|nr:unnamed protein product [Acanthoscelides obtectus]CAK1647135.1 Protein ALP1-like [Acanthoscelides obtectus]
MEKGLKDATCTGTAELERVGVTVNGLIMDTWLINVSDIGDMEWKVLILRKVDEVTFKKQDEAHHFQRMYHMSLLPPVPSSTEEWKEISKRFEEVWNFPHCVGAVDGKHVLLQAPMKSGSDFFNYKSQYSIVLMAVVDVDYNFTFVDIGCQGRISDGGVFKRCDLYQKIANGTLNFPQNSPLPGRTKQTPYVLIGDAVFPLCDYLIKPYSGNHERGSMKRIFNYRLSRARRVVENAFGIASSVFRVLRKPMLLEPEKAQLIVMTIVCLHNFLRKSRTSRNVYTPPGSLDEEVNGHIVPGSAGLEFGFNASHI